MPNGDQISDELNCVENFLRNSGRRLADWEIKKVLIESDVDVLAVHRHTDERLKIQVTRFNGKASRGAVEGLKNLVAATRKRVQEKEKHYGIKNTLDLILLLASYTDFPTGIRDGLKKRLAELKFEGFKEIQIVCPSANWTIKSSPD